MRRSWLVPCWTSSLLKWYLEVVDLGWWGANSTLLLMGCSFSTSINLGGFQLKTWLLPCGIKRRSSLANMRLSATLFGSVLKLLPSVGKLMWLMCLLSTALWPSAWLFPSNFLRNWSGHVHLLFLGLLWTHPGLCQPHLRLGLLWRMLMWDGLTGHPRLSEEMAVRMAKGVSVQFPFRNPQTGEVELHTLNSRYERPALSFLYGLIRKAVLWLFGLDEFREVLFSDVAKTDLRIHRPTATAGLYVKLADCGVQRCHQHMTGFTASRPIRRSGDLARPAWDEPRGRSGTALLCPVCPWSSPRYLNLH